MSDELIDKLSEEYQSMTDFNEMIESLNMPIDEYI